MHRKKCCNCRYFEPNNMAGSGWCRHPDRADISDLVMVRKNELNCRNTWDQDLWEPLTAMPQRAQVAAALDVPVAPPVFVPPPDATDRVEAIGLGVIGVVKPHLAPVSGQGKRYFSRVDEVEDEDGDGELPWLPRAADVVPETAAESFDDLPQAPRSGHSLLQPERLVGLRPFVDMPQAVHTEPSAELPTVTHQPEVRPLSVVEPASGTQTADRETVRFDDGRAALPSGLLQPAHIAQAQEQQLTEPLPELPETPRSTSSSGTGALPSLPASDGTIPLARRALIFDERPKPSLQRSALMAHGSTLANLPRCCGTCRDFKRNADGTGGICTNAYAFPDGAVVKSDVLACSSSMGVWWLPNDDLFVNAVDTSHHSRPTPYLDAALGQRAGNAAGRDSRAW